MLPCRDIDRAEVEQVSVGIVAVDFEYFGNETSSGPSLYLDDDIKRIRNVGLDGAVRQLDTALEDAARKT